MLTPDTPQAPDRHFAERLIRWQQHAGRHDLPWQKTRDPYRIWLSEIMLQQTQVSTVIPYYQRFLARFPSVQTLAEASTDEVIAHWAGLGYYARARNLHRCAQAIVAVHAGAFPESAAQLAELPGIGRSTAAAIAAFAFGQRAAILDGNVKRVLCRHQAISGQPGSVVVDRQLWSLAESLLPDREIEAYTQGLMDLGATLCTRRQPACTRCPLAEDCQARQQDRQHEFPSAKPRRKIAERHAEFAIIRAGDCLLLERRPGEGIWGGLLVPPEGEAGVILASLGLSAQATRPLSELSHAFTHFRLRIQPVLCEIGPSNAVMENRYCWVPLTNAADAGVPTPFRKLFKQLAAQ